MADELPDDEPVAIPERPVIQNDLPPVEVPTAGFILQLFFIPMLIVAIIVMVWLSFSWLAHMGSNPQELVQGLRNGDDAAWQKAGILADMLRDRRREHLKYDRQFAGEVAKVLDDQIKEGLTHPQKVKLRLFLCRTLGEFHVADVLQVLLRAASVERDASNIQPLSQQTTGSDGIRDLTELDVRRAALEAIAILIKNVGEEEFRDNEELRETLVQASSERGNASGDEYLRRELRSTAAYVLGVLGGEQSLDRLVRLLDDPYPNTRFNAATGLARHGDRRAVVELVAMLDPQNDEIVRDEQYESGKLYKRSLVISNGIQAAILLGERNQRDDLTELQDALEKLTQAEVPASVRLKAQEAKQALSQRNTAADSP